MRTIATASVFAAFLAISGCVGAGEAGDPADRYTINRVTQLEVATGNNESTRSVNRNTRPGEVRRIVDANPGLGEALRRNGVDLSRVATIRVRPTKVVDVFLLG
jgi:hypothetical protein